MASFFEKLKRGMNIDDSPKEEFEEKPKAKPRAEKAPKKIIEKKEIADVEFEEVKTVRKPRKLAIKAQPTVKTKKVVQEEPKEEKISFVESLKSGISSLSKEEPKEEIKEKWQGFGNGDVGELAVDIYQTENELVIQTAIAGVKPEDIDISLEGDVILIKGIRNNPYSEEGNYFFQECYWGPFAKELILPVDVDPNLAKAEMKEGVLTIRIPKIEKEKRRKIIVKD